MISYGTFSNVGLGKRMLLEFCFYIYFVHEFESLFLN